MHRRINVIISFIVYFLFTNITENLATIGYDIVNIVVISTEERRIDNI